MDKLILSYTDDDGDEVEFEVPWRWEICSRCRGHGKHVNPNIDGHGLSQEDFEEDPDFRESYFAGVYDVACENECFEGKERVPNEEEFTQEQKEHYEKYEKAQESLFALIEEAERKMGA